MSEVIRSVFRPPNAGDTPSELGGPFCNELPFAIPGERPLMRGKWVLAFVAPPNAGVAPAELGGCVVFPPPTPGMPHRSWSGDEGERLPGYIL